MNTENIPQVGSKWVHEYFGAVQVVACTPRGKPPGRQVKFATLAEETDTATAPLKKFLRDAKPL